MTRLLKPNGNMGSLVCRRVRSVAGKAPRRRRFRRHPEHGLYNGNRI